MTRWHRDDDPAHALRDRRADLQQAQPKRAHHGATQLGVRERGSHLLKEHEGCRSHEHAKLVRAEACTARAVDLQVVLELLDPVLAVAAVAVEPPDLRGAGVEVGDDVAVVASIYLAVGAQSRA